MKAFVIAILSFMLPAASAMSQKPDSLRYRRTIPAAANFATADNLSNTYLITPDNAIEKYDSTGRQTGVFTNNRLGEAGFIDASNPLKILVWYPDFQTALLLDRTMSEMGRLNFTEAGLFSVRCVAMAFDGQVWAFDDALSKAVKLDLDGAVLLESQPLNLYTGRRFSPTRIRDSGRLVYLNDPAAGLCLLDQYAKAENFYTAFKMNDFETAGDWLYYLEKDRLCLRNLARLQEIYIPLPAQPAEKPAGAWLGKQGVFVQHGVVLNLYAWQ